MSATSWRLQVRHHTGLKYGSPVIVSFNEARMTPVDDVGQTLLSHSMMVNPGASIQRYVDYWGTAVEGFDVHEEHTILEVTALSIVETAVRIFPTRPDITWNDVHDEAVVDRWCEFLRTTGYVDDAMTDPARASLVAELQREPTPYQALVAIVDAVRAHLFYYPGSTSVSTTASQAWARGAGVCQDFTHTTLSLLRACGIPARYVSGYLYTGEGVVGVQVVGESHAWVEAWLGEWVAVDPTNGRDVDATHVVVARGRDYSDVSPLKGIYSGGRSQDLGVEVSLIRLPR